MAKIVQDIIVVKLSKLVKDDDSDTANIVDESICHAIEEAVQNLVSDIVVVEVERN